MYWISRDRSCELIISILSHITNATDNTNIEYIVAIDNDDPFSSVASILKGYHELNPLNKHELNSIIYLMCMRLCISITMAVYRKKLFPENKYLIVSEMKARKFLKKMLNEDLNKWANQLIEFVR